MKTMTMESLAEATIPVTTRQAYKILDEQMTDEDIRTALSKTKNEFVTDQHFDLGMWIRNNWIYGGENEEECFAKRREACVAMLTGQKKEVFALYDPERMSTQFLEKYYDHLKRKKILL